MAHRLLLALLALVLCCLGFAAVAQGDPVAREHGCSATALEKAQVADTGTSCDSEDESLGNDEQRFDCTETLISLRSPFVAMAMTKPAAQPPAFTASPFLAQPKRPPRA